MASIAGTPPMSAVLLANRLSLEEPSASRKMQDILRSYDLQASCYVTKPVDFEQFLKIVKDVENFWFSIVKLPDVAA